nr:DUF3558 domain-containing protein [Prauserella muralis]
MRTVGAALAAAALGALLASCSATEPGSALPRSGASAPPSSTGVPGGPGVPAVSEPLDPSPYLDDPCKLAEPAALAELGYGEPGTKRTEETTDETLQGGPSCGWFSDGAEGISVVIQTVNRERGTGGLGGVYESYKDGQRAYWEPTTVNGYPAAYTDKQDFRDQGECGIVVGIQDDLSFAVGTDGYVSDPERACADAQALAGVVIETLKGGA